MNRISIAVAVGCAVILGAGMAQAKAKATAEQKCQAERAKAAGTYASCQQQAQAKLQTTGFDFTKFEAAASKCRVKYAGTWAKLQAKAGLKGSSCAAARFVANGDGTVTDNLTGLVWEQKANLDDTPNLADRHDADNVYTWCVDGNSDFNCDNAGAADGTAYTDFLRSLNSECLGGQCDWRLPTRDELQTILADPFSGSACPTPSCIDATFGPTQAGFYWSATSQASTPANTWYVTFLGGSVGGISKTSKTVYVRGVRGGL